MGEVVTLNSLGETLDFKGAAAAKVEKLVDVMLAALTRVVSAQDECELYRVHDELLLLQADLARAQERVQFVEAMLDTVNDQRRILWDKLPDGKPAFLIACRNDGRFAAALKVKRNCARIECCDLSIVEAGLSDQKMVRVA